MLGFVNRGLQILNKEAESNECDNKMGMKVKCGIAHRNPNHFIRSQGGLFIGDIMVLLQCLNYP
jgi:hypothetical protein